MLSYKTIHIPMTATPAQPPPAEPKNLPATTTDSALIRNITILISTCDSFYDVWTPNFCLWAKFWPDCPFPVYLLTNRLRIDEGPIKNIPLGEDRGWSDNLIAALDRIPTPYIFYFQEDHFLMRPVLTDTVLRCAQVLEDTGADFFMFRAGGPKKGDPCQVNGLSLLRGPAAALDTSDPDWQDYYSLHCDPAIWRKDSLRRLLVPGETAWDFLRDAIGRAHAAGYRYYQFHWNKKKSAHIPIYYMKRSGVRMNMWHLQAVWLMHKNKVPLWPLRRPLLLFSTKIKRAVRGHRILQPLVRRWLEAVRAQSKKVRAHIDRRLSKIHTVPLNQNVRRWAQKTLGHIPAFWQTHSFEQPDVAERR
jgi:hypothetical protein